jgi:hypothetical protein
VRLAHVRLLVKNEERDRDVTLPVSLSLDGYAVLVPGPSGSLAPSGEITSLGFSPATWTPDASAIVGVPSIRPLTSPIRVGAGGQEEGDIFFAIPTLWAPALVATQRGRLVVTDRKTDKTVEFEYGYPDDWPRGSRSASTPTATGS